MLVVTLQNMSNLAEVSDYDYEVWVTTTARTKKYIAVGEIKGHKRSDGWKALVQRVLDEVRE